MTRFTDDLLSGLGPDMGMGDEVVRLMRWLEDDQGNLMRYTSTNAPFLPTTPVASIDALWSHLAFVIDPDMVRYWLGREDMANTLVSILRCGGDGSHIALWRDPEGQMRYVFAGSEGAAFVIADTPLDFVRLITMGYESIETREALDEMPQTIWEEYNDAPWQEPVAARDWVRETFSATYPDTGAVLLPRQDGPDPFAVWVDQNTGY